MRLLCNIMETDYTEALTPICVSLTNLAERQLHAKDEEASTRKSRHGGQPPAPAGGTGQVGRPVPWMVPTSPEAAWSPESQALLKRPPLPKSEEVKVVHTSSGSPLLSSHLPPTLAQTPGQGSWLRHPAGVSSLAPVSPLEGLYIPSESSGTTPTRPSDSP